MPGQAKWTSYVDNLKVVLQHSGGPDGPPQPRWGGFAIAVHSREHSLVEEQYAIISKPWLHDEEAA